MMAQTPPIGTLNEERWVAVLQAAGDLFREKGYSATSLDELAVRVGILKGSLYYYARNKEDLLFELLRRSHEKGLRLCEEHDPALRTSSASIRLAAFIERWMCGIDHRTYHYTGIGLSEVRFLSESRRLEIAGMQKQLTSYVTNIVRQGMAERSFDSTVRPTLVTSTLFSLLNTTHVWFDADNMAWSEISAWYADLFLRRLRSAA